MSFRSILKVHEKFTDNDSLEKNLLDGYLLAHNLFFKNLRESVLALGYRLSSEPLFHYSSHPLSRLPIILKKKVIPYTDNISVIKEFLPTLAGDLPFKILPPVKNYIFHESCHGVAREIFLRFVNATSLLKVMRRNRATAFQVIMEESFANTCEFFGWMFVDSKIHALGYGMNAYPGIHKGIVGERFAGVKTLGVDRAMKLLYLACLYSNFLFERMPKYGIERALALIDQKPSTKLNTKDRTSLERLCSSAFLIPEGFRRDTSTFFFRFLDIKESRNNLLDFDPITILEKSEDLRIVIDVLFETVQLGLQGRLLEKWQLPSGRINSFKLKL